MRGKFYIIAIVFICTGTQSKAQDSIRFYNDAYAVIDSMLTSKTPLNFKKAVFATENAYFDGLLDDDKINDEIETLVKLINAVSDTNPLVYNESDKDTVVKQAAIFKVLTDTIPIILDSTNVFFHTPYTYDFDDMWAQKDWTKMFVSKLLKTGNGNCHSMPYLYKMIAEELHVPAYLAFAPNHIYIKLHCKKQVGTIQS